MRLLVERAREQSKRAERERAENERAEKERAEKERAERERGREEAFVTHLVNSVNDRRDGVVDRRHKIHEYDDGHNEDAEKRRDDFRRKTKLPNSDHSAKKRAVIHRGVNQRAHADVLCCGVVTVLGVVDVAIGCHRRVCTQRALTLDLECERVGEEKHMQKHIYIY